MIYNDLPPLKKNSTCAVTGHRILSSDFSVYKLKNDLENIINRGFDLFLIGMATGFDTECFSALEELKKDYPAGTRIRQFQQASHFHCWRGRPSAEWTPVSGRIAGIAADHAEKGKWWPTARFFRIRIAANIATGKDAVTEIRNIKLEIVRPSYF